MALASPSSPGVVRVGSANRVSWTNEAVYTNVRVWHKMSNETTWNIVGTVVYAGTSYDHDCTYTGALNYQYYVTGFTSSPLDQSDPSATVEINWPTPETDTITDTVTLSDSTSDLHNQVDAVSDTVTATDSESSLITWASTITDTVTATDTSLDSQSIKTNFAYYVGMYDGTVHAVSDDYLSDNGTGITSIWETIETNLGIPTVYKTVYKASLRYVDKTASTPVSVNISNDGGLTWTGASKTVGTADQKTHTKSFFFVKSGEYFKFKVELASTDKEFKIIGLDIDFAVNGDTVET